MLCSFIIPVYNEQDNIIQFLTALKQELSKLSISHEIVVIDDGSVDNTLPLVVDFISNDESVKCLELSRNFGKEHAITAGLNYASGDAAIIMDADFQHPFELIKEFIRYWKKGYDIVYGTRSPSSDEGCLRKALTRVFYKIFIKVSHLQVEQGAGDFRLIDRKVIDALNKITEHARFMKGLYSWVGFKSIGIPFDTKRRVAGKSHYNLTKLFNLASIGITSFSVVPLRLSTYIGICTSFISVLYGLWIILRTMFFGIDLPGWSTLVSGMFLLGGIQLTVIGILGEYIGHIFTEVKQRPNYIVSKVHQGGQKNYFMR